MSRNRQRHRDLAHAGAPQRGRGLAGPGGAHGCCRIWRNRPRSRGARAGRAARHQAGSLAPRQCASADPHRSRTQRDRQRGAARADGGAAPLSGRWRRGAARGSGRRRGGVRRHLVSVPLRAGYRQAGDHRAAGRNCQRRRYRFAMASLQEAVSGIAPAARIAAFPDALTGQRIAGMAPDRASLRQSLAMSGHNPLLANAFRPRASELQSQ
jgi:hypothetical protein